MLTTLLVLALNPLIAPIPYIAHGVLQGEIKEENVTAAVDFIQESNRRNAKSIVLEINSEGGSVKYGFLLAKAIENSNAHVVCVVDGEASSMAFFVLQSCHHRFMTRRSTLMTHNVYLEGPPERHRIMAMNERDEVNAFSRGLGEFISGRMHMSYSSYAKHVENRRDWYLDHVQAVHYKAVDRVFNTVFEVLNILQN
jgi:ATP-dependent protease ClpP protease subunit